MAHPIDGVSGRDLFTLTGARSRRASSWDRTGGNQDYVSIEPGQTVPLLEYEGSGCITHIYCAFVLPEPTDYRDAILRCYWDGEESPSVEVPLGDFFTIAHARIRNVRSHLAVVNPGFGPTHGMNAYFPMPFSTSARVLIENRAENPLGGMLRALWYHIEYETYEEPPPGDVLRFHAQWRQEKPTQSVGVQPNVQLHAAVNNDGVENYVALDATGAGQMVGLVLEINNVAGGWYGEGDDMVFVDGDVWPPSIHGTGSEEIFGGGACPNDEYFGPYSGFHLIESPDFAGLVAMYRWYVHDPIRFNSSLRWTIEHGHANNFANEYYSLVSWYQTEPHASFPALPSRDELLPVLGDDYAAAREAFFGAARTALGGMVTSSMRGQSIDPKSYSVLSAGEDFYAGRWARVHDRLREI